MVRSFGLPLTSSFQRLSAVYGSPPAPGADIPYRQLLLTATGGSVDLSDGSGIVGGTVTPSAEDIVTPQAFAAGYLAYQNKVKADGATSYWPLTETSGTTVTDIVSGINGTITAGITFNAPGVVAGDGTTSLDFGNGLGRIDAPRVGGMLPRFSIEAWVYQNSSMPGVIGTIFGRAEVFNGHMTFFTRFSDKALGVNIQTTGNPIQGPVLIAAWSHVVAVYDGTALHLYVNGTQTYGATAPAPGADDAAPNPTSTIGYNPYQAGDSYQAWSGRIADLAWYSGVALTPTQVSAHYTARLAAAQPVGGLGALVLGPFDEGPMRLSDLYARGAGATLLVLGVPF